MRLTCPNCGAQYEVPDEVIPESGRDVQCSNCGDTWFQHHPDFAPDPDDDLAEDTTWDATEEPEESDQPDTPAEAEPEAFAAEDDETLQAHEDTPPTQRDLDPAVSELLRDEAERERAARAADGGGLETQPELGLSDQPDEADKRTREAQTRMARLRGEEPDSITADTEAGFEDGPDPGTRRNLLPDIDEINSSLASDGTDSTSAERAGMEDPVMRKPGGFRRGFRLMILLAVLGLLVYVFAPQIARFLPALEQPLSAFVDMVNGARVWLDGTISNLMGTMDSDAGQ